MLPDDEWSLPLGLVKTLRHLKQIAQTAPADIEISVPAMAQFYKLLDEHAA